ncbi:MAG: transposase [Clostridiales Family XIII bacterium]|jgi:transposase|nr:transposase [Clostridiales Family XIII bacterium]
MIIHQYSLFSFDEILKFQPETQLMKILDELDFSKLERALGKKPGSRGPKGYSISSLLAALVSAQLAKDTRINKLTERLRADPVLRWTCGFGVLGDVPSESVFCRLYEKLAATKSLMRLFRELVLKAKERGVIEGTRAAIDSSELEAYEKARPSSKLPDDCIHPHWGVKKGTDGVRHYWYGWKVHAVCDCKSELPMEILVTPANTHDSGVAIPLLRIMDSNYGGAIDPKHVMMDSGYDAEYIYDEIAKVQKRTPVIALNERSKNGPPEGMNEKYEPVCSMGYPLTYYGRDGDFLKFRCPHMTGRCDCPMGTAWCSPSNYGYTLKLPWKEDLRRLGYPHRASAAWQTLYNMRTSVERMFSRLKEKLNMNNIRVAGLGKARVHVLLNCITLIAGTLAVN